MTPNPVSQLGDQCSLYIDMATDAEAIEPGDWITTRAGSRYLVATARPVHARHPRPSVRWKLHVHRLPRHSPIPLDVRAVELRWYRR